MQKHSHPDSHSDVEHLVSSRLSAIGQRFTSGRKVIVEVLSDAQRPLSLPEILEQADGLAQSSAYRNLTVLENAGVVVRVITTDEWARYELSEDITGHHHHMVCSKCGAVADVRLSDNMERKLDEQLAAVAKEAGFIMDHHRLDVVGVCKACG